MVGSPALDFVRHHRTMNRQANGMESLEALLPSAGGAHGAELRRCFSRSRFVVHALLWVAVEMWISGA
jgi:hypothetical protein